MLSSILLTVAAVYLTDTIPPTATISSEQNYTSAEIIGIDIKFSEACVGHGVFKCVNSSDCDVNELLRKLLPSKCVNVLLFWKSSLQNLSFC